MSRSVCVDAASNIHADSCLRLGHVTVSAAVQTQTGSSVTFILKVRDLAKRKLAGRNHACLCECVCYL